jgi:hypothetical protein
MRRAFLIVTVLACLVAPQAAPGADWLQTRTNAANVLRSTHPSVTQAKCYPPTEIRADVRLVAMPNAQSEVIGGARWWSHFVCVGATRSGAVFAVVFAQTGPTAGGFHLYRIPGISSGQLSGVRPLPLEVPAVTTPTITIPTPTVPLPPSGLTAICRDGTPSYSAHHQGTCSHHGGVSTWYR